MNCVVGKLKMMRKYESGQALVLILLSLSVVLTIILYVLSRSVTDISISTHQSDSVRAFSAAEAGVETALITGSGTANSVSIGDASYSVNIANAATSAFNFPVAMLSGDTTTLWFVSHKSDGSITCDSGFPDCFTGDAVKICWGKPGTSSSDTSTPAIEFSVYYESTPGDLSTVKIARAAYDPYSARTVSNYFGSGSSSECIIGGTGYAFQNTITLSGLGGIDFNNNGLLFARIRMLYNTSEAHPIGFSTSSPLPSQGLEIVSTGTSGTGSVQSNRRISVFQGWPEFPLSGLAVYSPAGVTKH